MTVLVGAPKIYLSLFIVRFTIVICKTQRHDVGNQTGIARFVSITCVYLVPESLGISRART